MLFGIDRITHFDRVTKLDEKDDKKSVVTLSTDSLSLQFEETPIKLKVGDNKVTVTLYEFMQAFNQALETGEFEMDQIDSEVWKTEKELEEFKEALEGSHARTLLLDR